MHTDGPPKEIILTFQEEDRQKASYYTDGNNCLIATTLKRMGFEDVKANVFTHYVDGFFYYSDQTGCSGLCGIPGENRLPVGPYYRPEIVGKTVTLSLMRDQPIHPIV